MISNFHKGIIMQKTLMASLIGLAVCTGNAFNPAVAAETKQPNLVIIMADDLGYGDLATELRPKG